MPSAAPHTSTCPAWAVLRDAGHGHVEGVLDVHVPRAGIEGTGTVAAWPRRAATMRGGIPSLSARSERAPASQQGARDLHEVPRAAWMRGVVPLESLVFRSAPACMSRRTVSSWPWKAAQVNAVRPPLSPGLEVGAGREQQVHHRAVPPLRRQHEGWPIVPRHRRQVGTAVEQGLHEVGMPAVRGPHQGGGSPCEEGASPSGVRVRTSVSRYPRDRDSRLSHGTRWFTCAPAAARIRMISGEPRRVACIRGYSPCAVAALTMAPASTSIFTSDGRRFVTAQSSAVRPSVSAASGDAPSANARCAAPSSPARTASSKASSVNRKGGTSRIPAALPQAVRCAAPVETGRRRGKDGPPRIGQNGVSARAPSTCGHALTAVRASDEDTYRYEFGATLAHPRGSWTLWSTRLEWCRLRTSCLVSGTTVEGRTCAIAFLCGILWMHARALQRAVEEGTGGQSTVVAQPHNKGMTLTKHGLIRGIGPTSVSDDGSLLVAHVDPTTRC